MNIRTKVKLSFVFVVFLLLFLGLISGVITYQIKENSTFVKNISSILSMQEGMNDIDTTIQRTIIDTNNTVDNFIDTSTKIKHMVDEIEKINVISKENVFSIDNVSTASEHLHTMTENLNNELGKFKS